MPDHDRVRGHIDLVRELSNELAGYLYSLPEDVWRNANQYASGCERWKVADVVAHLVSDGMMLQLSASRALKGVTSPPLGYGDLAGVEQVDRVISLRVTFDEDLFPEFYTSCKQLNTLLAGLEPSVYATPAWQPEAPTPISALIERRVLELGVHGWDIRYGLDRAAGLSERVRPFLIDFLPIWLRTYFRGNAGASPVRYRFEMSDDRLKSYDIIISGDEFLLGPSESDDPDVTFRCDTDTYLLFVMGRLPFGRSVRRGRLSVEGDETLAAGFTDWFPAGESVTRNLPRRLGADQIAKAF